MSLSEAKVTLTLGEVNKLQSDVRDANVRISELKSEVVEAKLGNHDGITRQYQEAFLDAMPIVRFAIGNLHPMTVRGWPFEKLLSITHHLRTLPGIDDDQEETSGDMKIFAQECERWEKARDEGREQAMLKEQNEARGSVSTG